MTSPAAGPAAGTDPRVVRLVTGLAAGVALCLMVALPGAYFLTGLMTTRAAIEARSMLAGIYVSDYVMQNADLWQFEVERIRGRMSQLGEVDVPELRQAFEGNGRMVASFGDTLAEPVLSWSEPIYDSGVVMGEVRVTRSLQPLLLSTAWAGVFAALLGGVAFTVLRVLPLRLLTRAMSRAAHLATHDGLTGLPNRSLLQDRLQQALARARREGGKVALLCLDLDHFKEVNDTLGHAAGDAVLREATRRLSACIRETDTLARLGGDEFTIVQVGMQQPVDAEALAQRLLEVIAEPFDLGQHQVSIGLSIGVTLREGDATLRDPGPRVASAGEGGSLERDGDAITVMLQEADVALYRSKGEGRGQYRFFESAMNEELHRRRALEADLRAALVHGQFVLHFQPQIDLKSRRILGAEALLRWNHPMRGNVRPDLFIPLAEETGLILRIGDWVLREACRAAAAWPQPLRIAVNVSPLQFRKAGFVESVARALGETGLAPARLELEVTEGVLISDTAETLATLNRLHALGVTIAMDDFGTGYSSLGYLQKFPFDKIKIDASFIRGLGTDPHSKAIVSAVLGMGRALGVRVNAEGVEDEQQAGVLQHEGCEEVQGFLFSKAVSQGDFVALLPPSFPVAKVA